MPTFLVRAFYLDKSWEEATFYETIWVRSATKNIFKNMAYR